MQSVIKVIGVFGLGAACSENALHLIRMIRGEEEQLRMNANSHESENHGRGRAALLQVSVCSVCSVGTRV